MSTICKACGHEGSTRTYTPSYLIVEICIWVGVAILASMFGWILMLGALGYSVWRQSAVYKGCAKCKSRDVIPVDSPIGQQLKATVVNPTVAEPAVGDEGICPNCLDVIPVISTECPKCSATFGPNAQWQITALPKT